MDSNQAQCDPTEKTLYTEPHSDDIGTWQDRMYLCGNGDRKGIGIDVGGEVFVMPLKKWHKLATEAFRNEMKPCPNCSTTVDRIYNVCYGDHSAVVCSVCIESWKRRMEKL